MGVTSAQRVGDILLTSLQQGVNRMSPAKAMLVVRSFGLPISSYRHLGHKYPAEMLGAVGFGAGAAAGTGKLYQMLMDSREQRRRRRRDPLLRQVEEEALVQKVPADAEKVEVEGG